MGCVSFTLSSSVNNFGVVYFIDVCFTLVLFNESMKSEDSFAWVLEGARLKLHILQTATMNWCENF